MEPDGDSVAEDKSHCVHCRKRFEKQGKNYGRTSLDVLCSPKTANTLFAQESGYLCPSCVKDFRQETVPVGHGRKRTLPKSPGGNLKKSRKTEPLEDQEISPQDAISKCTTYFRAGMYRKGLQVLVNNSCAARRALIRVNGALVKKEVGPLALIIMKVHFIIFNVHTCKHIGHWISPPVS